MCYLTSGITWIVFWMKVKVLLLAEHHPLLPPPQTVVPASRRKKTALSAIAIRMVSSMETHLFLHSEGHFEWLKEVYCKLEAEDVNNIKQDTSSDTMESLERILNDILK